MSTFWQDLRFALRGFAKSPGFTVVAVLTLALGIGATTSVFSVCDAVILRPLPVAEPDQLVVFTFESRENSVVRSLWGYRTRVPGTDRFTSASFSYPLYRAWQEQPHDVLSSLFAFFPLGWVNVQVDGASELAESVFVAGEYFSGLGLQPAAGRLLVPSDDTPGAPPVAVVGYAYWQARFGGSADAVGKAVFVNGKPFEIVGVAPAEFYGTVDYQSPPQIVIPLAHGAALSPDVRSLMTDRETWWLGVMGRLKAGVTRAQAEAALRGAFEQQVDELAKEITGEKTRPALVLLPGRQGQAEFRHRNAEALVYSLAVVGLILLIACANVAGLLLARAGKRQREMAVRVALGCGRGRLIRQLLTESLLLAVLGGVAGVLVAAWFRDVLFTWLPIGNVPPTLDIPLDLRVLVFAAGLCGLTVLFSGLVPAIQATRVNLVPALRESAANLMGGKSHHRWGQAMVAGQMAISIVVLAAGGLFLRTLAKLEATETGFNPEHLLVFRLDGSLNGYEGTRLADLYREVRERVERIPGVRGVAHTRHGLLVGHISNTHVRVPGCKVPEEKLLSYLHLVGGDFFDTLQIPLRRGRDLTLRDDEAAPRVAVVNETFVRECFDDENPVGRFFSFGDEGEAPTEIVGVAADTKYASLRQEVPPTMYLPFRQHLDDLNVVNFYVRSPQEPAALATVVRGIVRGVDPQLPVFEVSTQEERIRASVERERQSAYLSAGFAGLALVLACIGLYGLMAQWVARRTNEMGIRIALGADRRAILRLVLGSGMRLVAVGVALGLAGAYATTRLIRSQLFGVEPHDPVTLGAVAVLLAVVALAACWIPALRATQVDPMVALRYE